MLLSKNFSVLIKLFFDWMFPLSEFHAYLSCPPFCSPIPNPLINATFQMNASTYSFLACVPTPFSHLLPPHILAFLPSLLLTSPPRYLPTSSRYHSTTHPSPYHPTFRPPHLPSSQSHFILAPRFLTSSGRWRLVRKRFDIGWGLVREWWVCLFSSCSEYDHPFVIDQWLVHLKEVPLCLNVATSLLRFQVKSYPQKSPRTKATGPYKYSSQKPPRALAPQDV